MSAPKKVRGWSADQVALLGTDTDKAVARRLGRSRSSVINTRLKLGIPAFTVRDGWGQHEGLIGQMPDSQIAKLRGVSRPAVNAARIRRGIPVFIKQPAQSVTEPYRGHRAMSAPVYVIAEAYGVKWNACAAKTLRGAKTEASRAQAFYGTDVFVGVKDHLGNVTTVSEKLHRDSMDMRATGRWSGIE